MPATRLDVLVPTHNRAAQLDRCVRSVLRARPSAELDVQLLVICNGCTDGSADVVHRLQREHRGRIALLEDRRRGKSHALNAGIASTSGELVAMIDDDEEVDAGWIEVIGDAFRETALDFIGGPYRPVWDRRPPDWLPDEYLAVVGSADSGSRPQPYTVEFPGILKGGNAVIRRTTLTRVGGYAEHLGPGPFSRLFSCEDEDMYWRLLKAESAGKYLPNLVVYHYISQERLTPRYFRRWCFWRGVSRGLMDRRHPLPVAYCAGIPAFIVGNAGRALVRIAAGSRRRSKRATFTDELRLWDLAGYLYGRHVYTLARFSPLKSRRMAQVRIPGRVEREPIDQPKAAKPERMRVNG